MTKRITNKQNGRTIVPLHGTSSPEVLSQEPFLKTLCLEQMRTERSRRGFVLMLLESTGLHARGHKKDLLERIVGALAKSTRQTDVIGWYKEGLVIGTIFTEIGTEEGHTVAKALLTKISTALANSLSIEQINQLTLSFHVFPDDWEDHANGGPSSSALYPESLTATGPTKGTLWIKRSMDIAGSLCALTVAAPVLAAIAIGIKLTSKGPVIFKQQRVGQYGRRFTFLKFRSMYTQNDPKVHQEFVTRLIRGENGGEASREQQKVVFKMTNDPRVTPFGRFLRRTSLDELPQFLNVLLGDMSLVGPRPPIPYEFSSYDIWHKRRLLAVKPGITGLWQVTARSRVGFADMVRLDLKYAQSHSLWLDLKILLHTPLAVLGGDGAH
jgi:lipopolysaccharide/colanic/teichoic acid biosynthesis glycosyltransferase